MERKLASIQMIDDIVPIPGADSVELAKVLGWQVIVKKGQFEKGQFAVFYEIDSVLPKRPEYAFLEQRKYRIKTMKSPRLGVMSQGLLMPVDEVMPADFMPTMWNRFANLNDLTGALLGMDVTKILDVQKYDPPLEGGKNTQPLGLFPTHLVPKTDELRIQSFPDLIQEMWGKPYVITDKYDGTSFTGFQWRDEFGVCSRNLQLKEWDDIYWRTAKKYDLKEKLGTYCKTTDQDISVQGEICGKAVVSRQNPLGLQVDELFIFSVYDIRNRKYFDTFVAREIATDLGLKFVTIIEHGASYNYTMEQILEKAKGNYAGTDLKREGIVIRPEHYTYSPLIGGQLSFKAINNEYLLEEK